MFPRSLLCSLAFRSPFSTCTSACLPVLEIVQKVRSQAVGDPTVSFPLCLFALHCSGRNGDWSDESPLWDRHPKVKKALNPVKSDDGIFCADFFFFLQCTLSIHMWFGPSLPLPPHLSVTGMPFDLYCRNYEVTGWHTDSLVTAHMLVTGGAQ